VAVFEDLGGAGLARRGVSVQARRAIRGAPGMQHNAFHHHPHGHDRFGFQNANARVAGLRLFTAFENYGRFHQHAAVGDHGARPRQLNRGCADFLAH
jgi:hypothetical protein